jgi:hypothetical protein
MSLLHLSSAGYHFHEPDTEQSQLIKKRNIEERIDAIKKRHVHAEEYVARAEILKGQRGYILTIGMARAATLFG